MTTILALPDFRGGALNVYFMENGEIRCIIVFQSLFPEDKKTGYELYDDSIKRIIRYYDKSIESYFYDISSENEIHDIIYSIVKNIDSYREGLLFHFEMHGDRDKGVLLNNRTFVSWENFTGLLREVNIATNNKLYVTMATCFGRYFYVKPDLSQKIPCRACITSSREVCTDDILEDFTPFFECLIETGNIEKANKCRPFETKFVYKDMRMHVLICIFYIVVRENSWTDEKDIDMTILKNHVNLLCKSMNLYEKIFFDVDEDSITRDWRKIFQDDIY